jgi:hypothetical protein
MVGGCGFEQATRSTAARRAKRRRRIGESCVRTRDAAIRFERAP